MRIVIAILILMACFTSVSAQPQMKLEVTEHDFGLFREEAGKQSYTFKVVNSGNQPLVIQNIVASCGCTTPDWTKLPIPPGGTGRIDAVYDPANRPGPFRKTLTVYSNSKPSPFVITLKGEVKGRVRTEQDFYPYQVGQLRFQGNSIAFPDLHNNEKRIRVLPVFNPSSSPVKVEFEDVPHYIELKSVPSEIKAGTKGLIECIYYGSKAMKWGFVNDVVRVKVDGKDQTQELFIQAVITEDFSGFSKSDLANAPVFRGETVKVDLGTLESGTEKEVEFTFRNDGKRDLIIRNIWGSSTCFRVETADGFIVPQGGKGLVKVSFSTDKLQGRVSRTVYMFTNDPSNSKVAFSVAATILPAKQVKK